MYELPIEELALFCLDFRMSLPEMKRYLDLTDRWGCSVGYVADDLAVDMIIRQMKDKNDSLN